METSEWPTSNRITGIGHWKANEFPEELARLRQNTGTSGGCKWEWEVNLDIANNTAELLRNQGIDVDILPATVPPSYWADVFISIHADGSLDKSATGFKVSPPRRDQTGKASELAEKIQLHHQESTKLTVDPNITRNMTGYYAFSHRRYKHAVHPMTTSVILETGFLTNPNDRKIIVDASHVASQGIAVALIAHLESEGLMELAHKNIPTDLTAIEDNSPNMP